MVATTSFTLQNTRNSRRRRRSSAAAMSLDLRQSPNNAIKTPFLVSKPAGIKRLIASVPPSPVEISATANARPYPSPASPRFLSNLICGGWREVVGGWGGWRWGCIRWSEGKINRIFGSSSKPWGWARLRQCHSGEAGVSVNCRHFTAAGAAVLGKLWGYWLQEESSFRESSRAGPDPDWERRVLQLY